MSGSQQGSADFSAAGPLRVPRDRLHQGRAGGGTEDRVDHEGLGQARVFERRLHHSGVARYSFGGHSFAGNGFAIGDFAIHRFTINDLAIAAFHIQQERGGYST